jgi:four helix bundle protein
MPCGASFPPPDFGDERVAAFRRHETGAWEGMHTPIRYEVLERVLSVVSLSRPLVAAIQRKDRDLASQVRRALSSVGLNCAEAFGSESGNSRLRFESARGSLYEAQAGLRIAIAWGYFTEEQATPALCAIDELGGRVYGLSRR